MKNKLKLLFLLSVLVYLFTSCQDNVKRSNSGYSLQGSAITILEIDGCQYLYKAASGDFTHKGNCSNPIHKCVCTCDLEDDTVEESDSTSTDVKFHMARMCKMK